MLIFTVAPTIEAEPSDGKYVVKKGKQVKLTCKTSGNPNPEIHWRREVCKNKCVNHIIF